MLDADNRVGGALLGERERRRGAGRQFGFEPLDAGGFATVDLLLRVGEPGEMDLGSMEDLLRRALGVRDRVCARARQAIDLRIAQAADRGKTIVGKRRGVEIGALDAAKLRIELVLDPLELLLRKLPRALLELAEPLALRVEFARDFLEFFPRQALRIGIERGLRGLHGGREHALDFLDRLHGAACDRLAARRLHIERLQHAHAELEPLLDVRGEAHRALGRSLLFGETRLEPGQRAVGAVDEVGKLRGDGLRRRSGKRHGRRGARCRHRDRRGRRGQLRGADRNELRCTIERARQVKRRGAVRRRSCARSTWC